MLLNSKIKTNGQNRFDVRPGMDVCIVLKRDQKTGILTRGKVATVLTPGMYHSRGIKVRLDIKDLPDVDRVGRVQYLLDKFNKKECPSCGSDLLVVYGGVGVCINCGAYVPVE